MKQIRIEVPNLLGERLDKFLVEKLKAEFHLSRASIQKMINSGNVKINHRIVFVSNTKLISGDKIEVKIPTIKTPHLKPQPLGIEIIYQDNDFLIINKANNIVVHPGAGNETNTLVNGLIAMKMNLSEGDGWRPGIVHRLDKQTTGLLIVAKNNLTHQKLTRMFSNHQIKKEYIAIVEGVIEEERGKIEMPIGRHPTHRQKMAVIPSGKTAITHFEVLKRFNRASLLKIDLESGRTHQIRVHFSHIKHAVYNDPIYSHPVEEDNFGQYLHASKLSFKHPITKKIMKFEAPLPKEFKAKLQELTNNK